MNSYRTALGSFLLCWLAPISGVAVEETKPVECVESHAATEVREERAYEITLAEGRYACWYVSAEPFHEGALRGLKVVKVRNENCKWTFAPISLASPGGSIPFYVIKAPSGESLNTDHSRLFLNPNTTPHIHNSWLVIGVCKERCNIFLPDGLGPGDFSKQTWKVVVGSDGTPFVVMLRTATSADFRPLSLCIKRSAQ